MCDMAVDLDAIADEAGFNIATDFSDELDSLQPFEENGSVRSRAIASGSPKKAVPTCGWWRRFSIPI